MNSNISLEVKASMVRSDLARGLRKADELVQEVRDHFNSYAEDSISPQLPEGYEFVGAERVWFDRKTNRYHILTGGIKTPDNEEAQTRFNTGGYGSLSARIGATVVDECLSYKHKHEWVQVSFGFKWEGCMRLRA